MALANRHTGIGSDGIILMERSETCDAKMTQYNADGTEGIICGNALRCVAKYLYENNIVPQKEMIIETGGGPKKVWRLSRQRRRGRQRHRRYGPGAPYPIAVPTILKPEKDGVIIGQTTEIGGKKYDVTCLSMGNPHCVVFLDDIHSLDLRRIRPDLNTQPSSRNG